MLGVSSFFSSYLDMMLSFDGFFNFSLESYVTQIGTLLTDLGATPAEVSLFNLIQIYRCLLSS